MSTRISGLMTTTAVLCLLNTGRCHAQFSVFDLQNFLRQVMSYEQQLTQVKNQATAIQNQITQIGQLAKTVSTTDFSNLSALQTAGRNILSLSNQAQGLGNTLTPIETQLTNFLGASGPGTSSTSAATGNAAAAGTTITWSDGTTSTVGAGGLDQNGFQIVWSDGTSTYIKSPTWATMQATLGATATDALRLTQQIDQLTQANATAVGAAATASTQAEGVTQAVQSGNQILTALAAEISGMTQTLTAQARLAASKEAAISTATAQSNAAMSNFWQDTIRDSTQPTAATNFFSQ